MELLIARLQRDNPQIVVEMLLTEDFLEMSAPYLQTQSPEMVISKMLDAYQTDKGVSWFESPVDFPNFADEYRFVKTLVDGYLQKEIPIEALAWLDMRRATNTLTIKVETQNGKQYYLNYLREVDKLHVVDLHTQKLIFVDVKASQSNCGISLGELFYQIHVQLTMMLQGRLPIKRCEAGATPKMPACQNIFVPGKKYCSDSCRMRIYQSKRRAELKRQDEESLAQARASLREYRKNL